MPLCRCRPGVGIWCMHLTAASKVRASVAADVQVDCAWFSTCPGWVRCFSTLTWLASAGALASCAAPLVGLMAEKMFGFDGQAARSAGV